MASLESKLKWIIWLSVFGALVSVYLTITHYQEGHDPFCSAVGGGCDIVSKGPWSEVDGILIEEFGIYVNFPLPVSAIGLGGFLFTIFLAWIMLKNKTIPLGKWEFRRKELATIMWWANVAGWIFALYLTYVEFIVLDTFCPYCDLSKIIFTIVLVLCYFVWRETRQPSIMDKVKQVMPKNINVEVSATITPKSPSRKKSSSKKTSKKKKSKKKK